MKKILIVTLMAASLVACKSKENDISSDKDIIILGDSSKLIPGNTLTDTALLITTNADGTTSAEAVVPGEKKQVAVAPVVRKTTPTRSSTTSSSSGSGTSSAGTNTGTTSTTRQKTGISKAAKGAIIGGVGGAAAGAIIGRNAKGAVIGGAVGAAGGYIIGRKKDKKSGRVQ